MWWSRVVRGSKAELALATAAVGAFGFILKLPCAQDGWGGSARNYYSFCYSDIGPLYYLRGFADGIVPYLESVDGRFLEYPVLIGFWMWLVGGVTNFLQAGGPGFVVLTWLTSLLLVVLAGLVMRRIPALGNRAWWFALSPALLLTLGINWDALAVLCSVVALWLWSRSRFAWAGVAVGFGTAAKLFPALLLVPMLAVLVSGRRWRDAALLIAGAAGSWLALNLPVYLLSADGWWEFYKFSRERGVDFGSLWLALHYGLGFDVTTEQANLLGMVVMAAGIIAIWLLRNRLDVFTASFALIALFALVNKVYSPQFWLWLTPLAALAAVRLREFALWQLAELVYFVGIWRYLLFLTDSDFAGGLNETAYSATIAVHWLATATLVALAVGRSLRNSRAASIESGSLQP